MVRNLVSSCYNYVDVPGCSLVLECLDSFSPKNLHSNSLKTGSNLKKKIDDFTEERRKHREFLAEQVFQLQITGKAVAAIKAANKKNVIQFNDEVNSTSVLSCDLSIRIEVSDVLSSFKCSSLFSIFPVLTSELFIPKIRLEVQLGNSMVDVLPKEQVIFEEIEREQRLLVLNRIIATSIQLESCKLNYLEEPAAACAAVLIESIQDSLSTDISFQATVCVFDPMIDDFVFENDEIVYLILNFFIINVIGCCLYWTQ